MFNFTQAFCRGVDFPLYNILLPALLTFLIGWTLASAYSKLRWVKFSQSAKWLVKICLGYGLLFPIYDLLFCPSASAIGGVLYLVVLTQPLSLFLGWILAPFLSKVSRFIYSAFFANDSAISSADKDNWAKIISVFIAIPCLGGFVFLRSAIPALLSNVQGVDSMGLVLILCLIQGTYGLYCWRELFRFFFPKY